MASPLYTNSVASPAREPAAYSYLNSYVAAPQTTSSRFVPDHQAPISIDIQTNNDSNQYLLTYALHYEVVLMKKAFQSLAQNRFDKMKKNLCVHLAEFHRMKRLKTLAFRLLHEHLIEHYGHRFAKVRAESIRFHLASKKFFYQWLKLAS